MKLAPRVADSAYSGRSSAAAACAQRPDHQAVPRRQHLLVAPRPNPLFADGEQLRPVGGQAIFQLRFGDVRHAGVLVERLGAEEDVAAVFPVGFRLDAVDGVERRRVLAERLVDFLGGPDVELALLALAVGVERAVERPLRTGHLALHPGQRLLDDLPIKRLAGDLKCLDVAEDQEGVVVEHLLEVGGEPAGVGAVAGEAAAEVVVDAAHRHVVEGVAGHVQGVVVAEAFGDPQQQSQVHRVGELRRLAEAAVDGVERPGQGVGRPAEQAVVEAARLRPQGGDGSEELGQFAGRLVDLVAARPPGVGQHEQHLAEAAAAVLVFRREIGAAGKRPQVGREEDGERPAALAGHALHGRHVDLVEIGPLLAVHLDGDEMFVEDFGDFLVLETLVLHDMAPVAGRVADAEEDRPVELFGALQRLGAPRVPVHGVVGVLAEVGAGFVGEAVGERRGCGHGGWLVGCGMTTPGEDGGVLPYQPMNRRFSRVALLRRRGWRRRASELSSPNGEAQASLQGN